MILLITFIIVFSGYSGWEVLQNFLESCYNKERAEEIASTFFFICVELGFVGYVSLIVRLIEDKQSLFFKFSKFILGLTIAALADRIFGDPYTVTVFDYSLFGFNLLLLFIDGKKIRTIRDKARQLWKKIR